MLPAEIRLQIWRCFHDLAPPYTYNTTLFDNDALVHPFNEADIIRSSSNFEWARFFAERMTNTPEILHVSRKFRALGLGWYSLGFKFSDQLSQHRHQAELRTISATKRVYCNISKDLMFLSDH